MCGITGIFNYQNKQSINQQVLQRMCDSVRHRGTDDEGLEARRLIVLRRRKYVTIWQVFKKKDFLGYKNKPLEVGNMVTLNIKTVSGEVETIKKFLVDGLDEEKKRLEYALELIQKKLKNFEKKFGMFTDMFLAKFKTGEINEDGETFEWWSDKKIVDELMEKLRAITGIEICQK